jgi:hypothetical protein
LQAIEQLVRALAGDAPLEVDCPHTTVKCP